MFLPTNFYLIALQNWLIMTGKIPGPFEIEWVKISDGYNNSFNLPKCTAFAIITSSLSMLKMCVDLNLLKIHLKGSDFWKLANTAVIYVPFFIISAMFRMTALSILITYASYLGFISVVLIIGINIKYGREK